MRPELCAEAVRLGRFLAASVPADPEVLGLVALMELQYSRAAARTTSEGEPILLLDQDRSRWDGLLIRRGLTALARAESLSDTPGTYVLQAAITGSGIVELNPSVALFPAHGGRVEWREQRTSRIQSGSPARPFLLPIARGVVGS